MPNPNRRRMLTEPQAAKLVVAVTRREEVPLNEIEGILERKFGKIQSRSAEFDFTQTDYYENEMGKNLKKIFLEFEGERTRDSLVAFKLETTALEEIWEIEALQSLASRRVNLDPMFVTLENVVVATSKNFPQRVYLGRGVYAELELIAKRAGFEKLPWSYIDYGENVAFFSNIRNALKSNV